MEIISNKNHQLKEKIVRDINRVNPNLVIDVGCGSYWSKPRIQNVVGFDQTKWKRNSFNFGEPDYICTIKEAKFDPECADVVMCIGSLNLEDGNVAHGEISIYRWTNEDILSDFDIVYKWSRKYIVMRARWELDFIEEVQNLYNLKLVKEIKNYPKSDNVIIAKTGEVYNTNVSLVPYNYYWWWEK